MGRESEAFDWLTERTWRRDQFQFERPLIEQYPRLDVRYLNRSGLFGGTPRIEWTDGSTADLERQYDGFKIVHRLAGYPQDLDDRLRLTWTPCNFGGQRPWFICPGCGERVAVLSAFPRFRCRGCHPLVYASTHRSEHWQPEPVVPVLMITEKLR
jgi:hypothetical protein